MALEFPGLGLLKNTLLQGFLTQYVELKFITIDKTLPNKPRIYLGSLTQGFYLKEEVNDRLQKIEVMLLNTTTVEQETWIGKSNQIELVRSDTSFVRYKYVVESAFPKPPLMQYRLVLTLNLEDKDVIS